MYRGIIHFHSLYSYDSLLSFKSIIKFAKKYDCNFLVLTDHDTIKGSEELKKFVNKNNLDIEIIIAAEYNTEYGDIIALGIENEIYDMKFDNFIYEVKKQQGLVLFPHPFKGHKNIEYIADKVDFIEVFNARTDDLANNKALLLSQKYNKPVYYATDAHSSISLKNCIIEFKKDSNFIKSLKNNYIKHSTLKKTYYLEVLYSQFVKAFKQRKLILLRQLITNFVMNIIKLKILRKV